MIEQTVNEWLKEAEQRFGEDHLDIKFVCPACKRVQSLRDFKERGLDPNNAYCECLGRHDMSIDCDWSAYGLLRTMGYGRLVKRDGAEKSIEVFDFAPSEREGESNEPSTS